MSGNVRMPRIDVHLHLAGVGTGGSGCWVSPRFRRRLTFRLLRLRHRLSGDWSPRAADQDWAEGVARRVRESELDLGVALGFDGVYGADGVLDEARSQMIVPPSWVFDACRRHSALIPGPSVNPHRADAMERLEECIEGGAVLLKWLPAVQAIDPSDRAHLPFYRRLAEAGLPLLVHAGGSENTFAEVSPAAADLRRLELPLEEGVPVIVAHMGVPVHVSRDENQVPLLRAWLARYPRLWVDNSGMANPARFRHLPRFASDADLVPRMVHGSDFPVPCNAFYYAARIGPRQVMRLERIRNRVQRDVALKRALGYPDEVLTRGAGVLANVDRWWKG